MQAPQNELRSPEFETLTALVADESPHMVSLVSELLEGFGFHTVRGSESAKEAEAIIECTKIDLIIFDLMDGEPNGFYLARKVRTGQNHPNQLTPLILMTSKADRATIFGARDLGVTEFLRKPFTAKDLFKKVHSVIRNPRAFVAAEDYFGPDRRRHRPNGFQGDNRRVKDATVILPSNS